jgi:hypothetical protein
MTAVGATLVAGLWLLGGGTLPSALGPPVPRASPAGSEPSAPEDGRRAAVAATAAAPTGHPARSAVDLVRSWDRRRAAAFAAGDRRALARLYVPGSRARTSDLALLAAYRQRGLRVSGMRMQLFDVEELARSPRRWQLRVTDRLVGRVALTSGVGRVRLPRDRATVHEVTFQRVTREAPWRVLSVR